VGLDGRDQELDVVGPASVDLVVDDDLILGLLQLDELAELGGLAGLPCESSRSKARRG
jgi:hypothetical protein